MKYKIPNPSELHMTTEQAERFLKFVCSSDLDFYEEYTIHLTDEQQEKFFDENSEFMTEFSVSRDKMHLLKDKMFRDDLRRCKE